MVAIAVAISVAVVTLVLFISTGVVVFLLYVRPKYL